jgi:predicted  nucleic acid-binding Zn-ribbon protein
MLNFKSTGRLKAGTKGYSLDFAETLQKLVELQKTDSGFDELERIKKGFLQEIATLEANLLALKNHVQDEKKAMEDLLKQRKTQEIEAGTLETKISKYLGQQNDVKSNEQFTALKQEIEKSKEEKAKAEERILESLFKEDEQKAKILNLNQQLALAEKKTAEDKKDIQQKIADCDKAVLEKKDERKKQLAEIPPEFADGYEKLRNNGKKIAVAAVQEDESCSGCHMNVSPQILNEIRKNIAVQRCNCGRYLYVKD